MLLGGGEHLYVFERFDLHRRDEVRRKFAFMLDYIVCRRFYRFLIRLIDIYPEGLGGRRMYVGPCSKRILSDISPREIWLDSRRCFGHERDRTGGGDRRDLVISGRQRNVAWNAEIFVDKFGVSITIGFKFRKHAFILAEFERSEPRFAPDKAHDLLDQCDRIIAAISHAHFETEVGKAHYAEADWTSAFDYIVDFGEREVAGVDYIIEELRRELRDVRKPFPIDNTKTVICFLEEFRDVDRAEIA